MKKIAWFLVPFLVAGIGQRTTAQDCASAANIYSFTYDGRNYEVIREKKNWQTAAACAVERGGHLAHIDDAGEQTALWDAVINGAAVPVNYTTVNDGGGIAYVWIGATDKGTEGTWLWDGDDNGAGANFWNGQGSNGSGNGSPAGGLYNHWGGSSGGFPKEPDNYNNQDGAAIGLAGWPAGSGSLGSAGEWNDINLANALYFIVEKENVGVKDPPKDPVILTPNPVKDRLTVTSLLSGPGIDGIRIIDGSGRTVKRADGVHAGKTEIDLAGLPRGAYLVVVTLDGGSRHYKKMILSK